MDGTWFGSCFCHLRFIINAKSPFEFLRGMEIVMLSLQHIKVLYRFSIDQFDIQDNTLHRQVGIIDMLE